MTQKTPDQTNHSSNPDHKSELQSQDNIAQSPDDLVDSGNSPDGNQATGAKTPKAGQRDD
jgi:hypothetical protein